MNIKFQIWLRLVVIALSVATGEYLPAAIALLAPIPEMWSYSLGVVKSAKKKDDDDEEEDEDDEDKDKKRKKSEEEDDEEETEEAEEGDKVSEATKALLAKVRLAAKKEVSNFVKAYNAEGEVKVEKIIDKKMKMFNALPLDKLKRIVDESEEINSAIAELKATQRTGAQKSKDDFFTKTLKEQFPLLKKHLEGGGNNFKFTLGETKAPNLVNLASFADRVIIGFRESGVSFAALPEIFIFDLISVMNGGPGSNPLSWIERNVHTQAGPPAVVANPTPVAESAVKPQLGWLWVENKMSAEVIAAIVPVTKHAVLSYATLEQEIRFELMRRLAYVLQDQIINGTGTTPQLKGINTYATAFAAGVFATAVNFASQYDVLVAAATQVMNNGFIPTAALTSNNSVAQMSVVKDSGGGYVVPPFATPGGLNVYGMKVIGTAHMPTDQFIVGDFTKSLFNWVENITIEIGMINDDFEKNQWRIRGELMGVHRIKTHEQGAFVKGDFSVAQAAMETP